MLLFSVYELGLSAGLEMFVFLQRFAVHSAWEEHDEIILNLPQIIAEAELRYTS